MKKLILLFIFISAFSNGQNTFLYSSYKMDDFKKNYNIYINYENDESKTIKLFLLDVYSSDKLFRKSKFLFDPSQFVKFQLYVSFLLSKKLEWDIVSKRNNIKEVTKEINWEDGDVFTTCVYEDGPSHKSRLYASYVYLNGFSTIFISSSNSDKVSPSRIEFSTKKQFEDFLNKLKLENIFNAINNNYNKKNLLK